MDWKRTTGRRTEEEKAAVSDFSALVYALSGRMQGCVNSLTEIIL